MQKLIIFIVLLTTVFADQESFNACDAQCQTDNSSVAFTSAYTDFKDKIFGFDYNTCTQYVYGKYDSTISNIDIATKAAACYDDLASTKTGQEKAYVECFSDCIVAEGANYESDFIQEKLLEEITVPGIFCLLECGDDKNCNDNDKECLDVRYKNRKLTIDEDITECEQLRYNYQLSGSQYNDLFVACYSKLKQGAESQNASNSNSFYPNNFITSMQCAVDCKEVTNYDMNFLQEIHQNPDNDDQIGSDCVNNYCLNQFLECNNKCDKSCITSDCYSDISGGYLSFIASDVCKEYLNEENSTYDNESYVGQQLLSKYALCMTDLETTHSADTKIMGHLTCLKACKDKPKKEEEKNDSASIISFVGFALISMFLLL